MTMSALPKNVIGQARVCRRSLASVSRAYWSDFPEISGIGTRMTDRVIMLLKRLLVTLPEHGKDICHVTV